jgi:hemerythrin superfamily protein
MKITLPLLATVASLALVPGASAATIGGTFYAPQYDYSEFFAATDRRNFQVILAGDPLPGIEPNAVARDLLPAMQAAKPRPALTFTYDAPAERPRPYYRLVLVFNAANDLNSSAVCNGEMRVQPGRPGLFKLYAVYCRNDQVMSETTAWTAASGPSDPRIGQLFRELFQVVFSDSPALKPNLGGGPDRNSPRAAAQPRRRGDVLASPDRPSTPSQRTAMPRKANPDAIALLKEDHRKVEDLFEKFEKARDDERKKALAREICTELTIHAMIEEEIFYPACQGQIEDEDLLDESYVEHDGAKVLISEIMSNMNARYFEAKVTVLSELIKHHVKEEEKRAEGLFAQAREAGLDVDALGDRLKARKEQLAEQFAGGHLPPAHTRSYTGHNLVQDKPLSAPAP